MKLTTELLTPTTRKRANWRTPGSSLSRRLGVAVLGEGNLVTTRIRMPGGERSDKPPLGAGTPA